MTPWDHGSESRINSRTFLGQFVLVLFFVCSSLHFLVNPFYFFANPLYSLLSLQFCTFVYICVYILCDSNNFSKSHRPALCVFSPSHLFALSILITSINILYLFALSILSTSIFVYNCLPSLFSSLLYLVSFPNCNCVICYIFPC